jgi:hypothetical protein
VLRRQRRGDRLGHLRLDMQDAGEETIDQREREQRDAGGAAESVLLACDFGTGHRGRIIGVGRCIEKRRAQRCT